MPAPNFLTAPPCNLGAETPRTIGGKPYPWLTPALEFLHTLARVRVRAYWVVLSPARTLLGVTTFTRPFHLSKLLLSRVRVVVTERGALSGVTTLSPPRPFKVLPRRYPWPTMPLFRINAPCSVGVPGGSPLFRITLS